MAKIIKNNLGNFLVICLIFLMMTVWIFSGKPQIWKKPAFPPEVQEARADSITFDTAGPNDWTSPAGIISVDVECWGGGGAGGGGDTNGQPGGGGGGGGSYAKETNITITAETLYNVQVGAGGNGGTGNGPPGLDSYFDAGNDIRAKGGSGGLDRGNGGTGGAGGVLGTGTARYLGGDGYQGADTVGGGGGEGSGSTADGVDATGQTGASGTDGGDGGSGGVAGADGAAGTAPGGAGGGGGQRSGGGEKGGSGATGRCTLAWTVAAVYSVSVEDKTVAYGVVALSGTADTTSGQTQIATNDGDTAKFNIKSTIATGAGTPWALVTSTGNPHEFIHRYSTNGGGSWATFETTNYYTLVYSIIGSDTQAFDLFIGMPSSTDDYGEKSITVTVQAVQP